MQNRFVELVPMRYAVKRVGITLMPIVNLHDDRIE